MTSAQTKHKPRGWWSAVGNSIAGGLTQAGFIPSTYLLTTEGRKTGKLRSNPVTLVKQGSRRWLVAPYGAVGWVHNVRAAGEVTLSRRGKYRRFAVREVSAVEAGPVLKQYVTTASATRKHFVAQKDDPAEAFAMEAEQHPVFELLPATSAKETTAQVIPIRRKQA
jgi:deazaflavin-dependent oxidoreductase (nitroreductase family)